MKICFLAPSNSIHSAKWISYFAERGHEVHWISLSENTISIADGISYTEIRMGVVPGINVLRAASKVKKLLQQLKPDVFHVHSVGTYGVVGVLAGWRPFIATAWGSDVLLAGKSIIKRPLVKHILRSANIITCDADHMCEAMELLGVAREKIEVIYFGIDTKRFVPSMKDADLFYSLDLDDGPVVISLRNFDDIYDVGCLIRAIPIILKEVPRAKFIVAGSGPKEQDLKSLAKKLSVDSCIRFTGRLDNDLLPKYINLSDVYVSTSLSDGGIAASTAEAMACGLSVVVTDTGDNCLWVSEGKGGYLIPVKDPKLLAARVVDLLKKPDFRDSCGHFNRDVIEVKNNFYVEMKKMENIYVDMVRKPEGLKT